MGAIGDRMDRLEHEVKQLQHKVKQLEQGGTPTPTKTAAAKATVPTASQPK